MMLIPSRTYVGLYGSHSGDWRSICIKILKAHRIPWYDPTDKRWKYLSEENGDSHQAFIDRLVAKQHQGMLKAGCVIFHLARRKSYAYKKNRPRPDDTGKELTAFATRCELGFLIGRGIQTFVYIEPEVVGRNYLWAAIKDYPHMVRCESLKEASELASRYILSSDSFQR